jgi:hypothetical protein
MIGPKGNCRIHAAHLHYVCMYVCMYTLFEMLRVSAVVIHSEAACFLEESYRGGFHMYLFPFHFPFIYI